MVGTTGLLVLPHVNPGPFVVPTSPDAPAPALPEIPVPERDHYAEFVDAVLSRAESRGCSASFDYAGPLTESVLIGNIAARFSGETLTFDGRTLNFPQKRDANQYLRRDYRSQWK